MPWCPTCRFEYVAGRTACSDCGAALVENLPPEAADPVVVLEANSAVEAQVAEATLEAVGIPAYVSAPQSLVPNVDAFGDEPAESEVLVAAQDAERARAVLAEGTLSEEELTNLAESASDPRV